MLLLRCSLMEGCRCFLLRHRQVLQPAQIHKSQIRGTSPGRRSAVGSDFFLSRRFSVIYVLVYRFVMRCPSHIPVRGRRNALRPCVRFGCFESQVYDSGDINGSESPHSSSVTCQRCRAWNAVLSAECGSIDGGCYDCAHN
jgi:hypothetical protein